MRVGATTPHRTDYASTGGVTMARTVHAVDAATAAQHLGTGRNTLLERLRNAGVTHSSGPRRNLPRQEYREAGLFATALTEYWQGDVKHLHEKLTITAAGMEFCRQLLELEQSNGLGTDRQIHAEKPEPKRVHGSEERQRGRDHLRSLRAALEGRSAEPAEHTQQRISGQTGMPATG